MKTKINMVGNGFTICSSALNTNKYVEWKHDNTANISIHIDNGLFLQVDKTKKNYGWLAESSAIIPHLINRVIHNLGYFKENFEYIFTHDRRIIDIDPSFFKFILPNALPWIQNKKIYDKTKIVSFVGSSKTMCEGHLFRQQMIQKYKDTVDHFGTGFGNKELPFTFMLDGKEESGKIIALKDYMFSIAMENANYDDIFCEKITDCFATGTIPIFWGTKNIGNYFDKNGIIFLDELTDLSLLTPELYYSKMDSIKKNFEIACNLLTSEDYMVVNYLKGDI
jgi:hypothetical protein